MKVPKRLSFFLSFLLVFNLVFSNWGMKVKAEEKASSIVISSILTDKTSAAAGDKVNVTLDVKDNVNGISKVSIQYKLPSGTAKDFQLISEDGKFIGSISIENEDNIIGDWKVNKIEVADGSGKVNDIYNSEISTEDGAVSLNGGDFKVLETKSQTTTAFTGLETPIINSITVDKSIVNVDDWVRISVNMSDSFSEISNAYLNYKLPSGAINHVYLEGENGYYYGDLNIWLYDESGSYKVDSIQFDDIEGNRVCVYNSEIYTDASLNLQDLSAGDLVVTGTTPDLDAPKINSIAIDKHTAAVGDIVTISIDASDDVSGINNYYPYVDYMLPSGEIKDIELNEKNGKYIGIINIGQYSETGSYRLDSIHLSDNAGHSTDIYNSKIHTDSNYNLQDLSAADIEVSGTTPDLDKPVLNSVSVDKKTAAAGDKVTITADVSDATSGIHSVSVNYVLPSGYYRYVELTQVNGKYTGTLDIGQLDESGNYILDSIMIDDNSGIFVYLYNSEIYSDSDLMLQDLSAGDIQVSGTQVDTKGPVLNSISADKTSYTAGDVINLTIDAADDLSGIDTITADYQKIGSSAYIPLNFDFINGKYKCHMVNMFDSSGNWKVISIRLTDKKGNTTNYLNSEIFTSGSDSGILKDLSAGDYSIYGTTMDNGSPEFESVTVDKKNAAEGDFVKVTVDAKDYESAISHIEIAYNQENGEGKCQNLYYDNGYFVGWIDLNNCSGLLQIKYLQMADNAGNCTYYVNNNLNTADFLYYDNVHYLDLSSGDINVSPSDFEKPVFSSLTIDKNNAVLGDKVKITISANDIGSGILKSNIYYVSTFGQSKEITATPAGNTLEGYFYVNKYDDSMWKISRIEIYDNSMNVLEINNTNNVLSSGNLSISGTSPDHTAPIIKDFYTEIKNLEKGQTQKFYLDAADDVSGIKSIEVLFGFNYDYEVISVTDFTFENGKYNASFNLDNYMVNSDFALFALAEVRVTDNRGNVNVITRDNQSSVDFEKGDFYYNYTNSLNAFGDAPIFKSMNIDKKLLISGEELTFTVDAEQTANPIAYSYIRVKSPDGKEETVFLQLVNGKYVGKLKILDYFNTGIWRVLSVTLSDTYMNTLVIKNGFIDNLNDDYIYYYGYMTNYQECLVDLRNCDFTVAGTNNDIKAPVFNSISISKNKAALGDQVKITVNASDDFSGIKSIYLYYSSNWNDYSNNYAFAGLDKVGNTQFEGYLWLTGIFDDTNLMIDEIDIEDNNGNINCIINNKNDNYNSYDHTNSMPKVEYNNRDLSFCDISVYHQSELYDLNKDGNLNILDVAAAAQSYDIKSSSGSWENVKLFDVNGDNVINLLDLVLLSKVI